MNDTLKHVLIALGVGCTAALALIPATGEINWRSVIVSASQAVLTAFGVGVAVNRSS